MDEAVFSEWALKICLTILIVFLGFIVWHLGKESKAGKFGTFILFLVLVWLKGRLKAFQTALIFAMITRLILKRPRTCGAIFSNGYCC